MSACGLDWGDISKGHVGFWPGLQRHPQWMWWRVLDGGTISKERVVVWPGLLAIYMGCVGV
jgi:hypothetical protein